jgi:glutaredoxin 3
MARVKVYGTGTCGYCNKAKALLEALGIPFEDVRIDLDKNTLREFAEVTGGARSVPQILIDGKCIGGYSDLAVLHQAGGLEKLTAGGG